MVRIGVCALQGAFAEHVEVLRRLSSNRYEVCEVRIASDLAAIDALIIPGGESTSMRVIGDSSGFLTALKQFVSSGRPCWGTCAGCILLSDRIVSTSNSVTSASLIGGVDVTSSRNFFGRQLQSFQTLTEGRGSFDKFPAIFIRAPAIIEIGPLAEKLASITYNESQLVVAARQNRLLVTCFHPELTQDDRIHEYFVEQIVLS